MLLKSSMNKLSDGVKDQSEAFKKVQIKKFYPAMYAKYAEELKELGKKEANPPEPVDFKKP